ncbi:hypothetical protein AB0D04_29235 [Streptomyces sp. NPDC048483]|uniref:hypothetical protein n=1 Tax=Streptomyces sp. NPDC048483 TaxID=3154927 RepID=UPI00342BC210
MGLKDQFQDKAERLKEQAQKARGAAKDEVSEQGRQAREQAQDAADDARGRFQD